MNTHTFLVSDESLNSHGFKVLTDGIDISNFERNPIMLYMHDRRASVIGRWENLRKKDGNLYADAVFDMEDPEASKIAGKVERGFLKSASIGIQILERENDLVTKAELFEISIVDIGSNKNALRLYNSPQDYTKLYNNLNLNTMDLLKQLISVLGLPENATEDDVIKEIKRLLDAEQENKNNQEKQSNALIDKAVKLGVLKASQKSNFQKLFKQDYVSTNETLLGLMEGKDIDTSRNKMLSDFVKGGLSNSKNSDTKKINKPKSEWTLTDYRKYAPNELRDNPQLYKELIDKTYNQH